MRKAQLEWLKESCPTPLVFKLRMYNAERARHLSDYFDPHKYGLHRLIFEATGRLTLYTAQTNFEALLANAYADYELERHVRRVLKIYRSDGDEDVLFGPGSALIADFMDWRIIDGVMVDEGNTFMCPHCDELGIVDDSVCVVTNENDDTQHYHPECARVSHNIYFCPISERWVNTGGVVLVTLDDGTRCELEHNLEFDNIVHYETRYNDGYCRPGEEPDEDEDEDEDEKDSE